MSSSIRNDMGFAHLRVHQTRGRSIRQLLLAAFTVEDLRRFCEERQGLEPILQNTSPNSSLADTVDKVITHCGKRLLFPELLAEIEEDNPRQYARFERDLCESGPLPSRSDGMYQVPGALDHFVGRQDVLDHLMELLNPGLEPVTVAIVGMGGLGKTELAKTVAQLVKDRFRDGVLWANCGQQNLAAIVDLWAAEYGANYAFDDDISKATAWRNLVNGKEALLIFDQLEPHQSFRDLFPSSGGSVSLITTRDSQHLKKTRAQLVKLTKFSPAEAMALAEKILGQEKACGQRSDAERFFELVGHLPLAVAVGLSVADDYDWSLEKLSRQLEQVGALKVLGDQDRLDKSLNATFQTALSSLPENLGQTFGALAVFNQGPSVSTQSVADTLALTEVEVQDQLHRLAGRSLLVKVGRDRWALHPLLRDFAARLEVVDRNMRMRMARHYADLAREAHALYQQGGECVLQGLALIDADLPHIRAGQAWTEARADRDQEAARLCVAYAVAGGSCLGLRLHPKEWADWLEGALRVAKPGDETTEGEVLGWLGEAAKNQGNTEKAVELYTKALGIATGLEDSRAEGVQLRRLGNASKNLGRPREALEFYQQAFDIAVEIDDRAIQAECLGGMGWAYYDLGDARKASQHHQCALDISRELGDRTGESVHLGDLGAALTELGEAQIALDYLNKALAMATELGDERGRGIHLGNLGMASYRHGSFSKAVDLCNQALEIRRRINDRRGEANDLGTLGLAYLARGETGCALDYCTKAVDLHREIGDLRNTGRCLVYLGDVHLTQGEVRKAIDLCEESLALCADVGNQRGRGDALATLGRAYARLGQVDQARSRLAEALQVLADIESPNAVMVRRWLADLSV